MANFSRRGFLGALGAGAVAARQAGAAVVGGMVPSSPEPEPERPRVGIEVNGVAVEVEVDADTTALDVVRERLGLTGTKLGCGHGACGACVILRGGVPVASCLLPAAHCDGASLTTVEGLAAAGLHPVQKAFLAEDALQCGYCTPGFVVEAAAFHDAWRASRGTATPGRDAVADALAGHLCRCGAYQAIVDAVVAACEGRHDGAERPPQRVEGREKVTGAARYTVDVHLDGMLMAAVGRSPHASATLKALDLGPVAARPGVVAVTALLAPGGRVRYYGQAVFAVAATTERAAREAARAARAEWEVHPAVVGFEAAIAEGAPTVWASPAKGEVPSAAEGPYLKAEWQGNLRGPVQGALLQRHRAAHRELERCRGEGMVVEGRWETAVACHTTLEPHAAVARWVGERRLELWVSTQAVDYTAHDVAEHFGLDAQDVTVVCDHAGAGFGAKVGMQEETLIAAVLAREAGRPVKVALDRKGELIVGGFRPAARMDFALAAHADGALAAMTGTAWSDSGLAVGHSALNLLLLMYDTRNKDLLDFDVATHGPAGKPFRGPGGPQGLFALETALDELAALRGEDPVALRRRWERNPLRPRLYDWADALPVWRDRRRGVDSGRFREGVGLAAGCWPALVEPSTEVGLEVRSGKVTVRCATQDVGQGVRTTLARETARRLGLQPHEVEVVVGSTGLPHGPMAGGSRITGSVVPAVMDATEQVRSLLQGVARRTLGVVGEATDAGLAHAGGVTPWLEIAAASATPLSVVGRRRKDEGGYFLTIPGADLAAGRVVTASITVVRVVVDTRTGRVWAPEAWLGLAVGRVVSPLLARSQARGGVVQGVSYALYEERRLDVPSGVLLTAGLEDYRVAGIGDAPTVHVHFEEAGFEHVPGGATGMAELCTVGTAAAVANAVAHATGWRARRLPLVPRRVLEGVQA